MPFPVNYESPMATFKVGGEVDAYCTRCKMDLAHTILAMVGTKIARVRCNTCGGDHVYRGTQPSSTAAPRAARPRAAPSPSGREAKHVLSFEQQLAGRDVTSAPRYSPQESYQVDQVLQHPSFGLGLVKSVRGDKMEVAFRAETKTLVQGRGGAPAQRPAFQPPSAPRSGPADKPTSDAQEEGGPSGSPADGQA